MKPTIEVVGTLRFISSRLISNVSISTYPAAIIRPRLLAVSPVPSSPSAAGQPAPAAWSLEVTRRYLVTQQGSGLLPASSQRAFPNPRLDQKLSFLPFAKHPVNIYAHYNVRPENDILLLYPQRLVEPGARALWLSPPAAAIAIAVSVSVAVTATTVTVPIATTSPLSQQPLHLPPRSPPSNMRRDPRRPLPNRPPHPLPLSHELGAYPP